jgi:O-antigen/teichoic acid export membrane protein
MIVASVFALLLSMLINGVLAWRNYLRELLHPNRSDMRAVSHEYANFPKFNLPRALVNSVGISLPVWLLTPHFGLSEVGQLSLAMMAAFVPLSIISRACYQVLYQRVAELVQNRRSVSRVLWRFCLWIAGALAVGLIPVFVFVPQLVTFIFGAEWLESAYIIRALYPFIVLTPICGSICFLSDVFAKQKTALWMEVGYVVALALVIMFGVYSCNFIGTIRIIAWTRCVFLTIQVVWFASLVYYYELSC